MVQFKILAGRKAGVVCTVEHFPARIGRSPASEICLEDAGVWDDHVIIELDPASGYQAALRGDAIGTINGQSFQQQRLRNGDVVDVGGAKLQFWIGTARQNNLRWRESAVWIGLLLLTVLQVILLWKLAP